MGLLERFALRRTLHAVVPVAIGTGKEKEDLERLKTLLQSLHAAFDRTQCLHVHIVGRASELMEIGAAVSQFAAPWIALSLHDELELVPELGASTAVGWVKQQIIKLAAAEWLDADYWLTFDADVVCVRNFGIDDLFVDGRALLKLIPVEWSHFFPLWAQGSARMLKYDNVTSDKIIDMTPVLYCRDVMRRVHAVLESATGKAWRQALLEVDAGEWAEMVLYGLVADREDLLERYHAVHGIDTDRALIAPGSNWQAEGWHNWVPPDMSDPAKPGYFIVCGSHTGVPAELVRERMAPVIARLSASARSSPVWARLPGSGLVRPRGTARRSTGRAKSVPVAAPRSADPQSRALDETPLRVKVISSQPLIVRGALDEWDKCFIAPPVLQRLGDLRGYFLINLPWSQHDMATAAPVAEMLAQRRRDFPQHSFFVLCNTAQEAANFRALGVPCGLFNHNIFVDQSVFQPLEQEEKRYDAVYNAALVEWKRQLLAREVPSVELLFANWHKNPTTTDYVALLRHELPRASFINRPEAAGEYRFLTPPEVARYINQARVGLCLSAIEGAMSSSMEYLLCGLPVVSTPSLGGRDLFFTADNSVIVEPDAAAVASGVAEMIRRRLSPQAVREAVVAEVGVYRRQFLRLVEEIYHRQSATWPPSLPLVDPFISSNLSTITMRQYERRIFQPGL